MLILIVFYIMDISYIFMISNLGERISKMALSKDIIFLNWSRVISYQQWMNILDMSRHLIQCLRYPSILNILTTDIFRNIIFFGNTNRMKSYFRSCSYLYQMIWNGLRWISIQGHDLITTFSWLGMEMAKMLMLLVIYFYYYFIRCKWNIFFKSEKTLSYLFSIISRNGYGIIGELQSYHFIIWYILILVWFFIWWKTNNSFYDYKQMEKPAG